MTSASESEDLEKYAVQHFKIILFNMESICEDSMIEFLFTLRNTSKLKVSLNLILQTYYLANRKIGKITVPSIAFLRTLEFRELSLTEGKQVGFTFVFHLPAKLSRKMFTAVTNASAVSCIIIACLRA